MIVGRRAFAYMNMLGQDRWIFVVTRDEDLLEAGGNHHFSGCGFWFLPDLKTAIQSARHLAKMMSAPEIFTARGASLYAQALPHDGQTYRTIMHETIEDGPKLETGSLEEWREVHYERRVKVSDGFPDQTYSVIERPS